MKLNRPRSLNNNIIGQLFRLKYESQNTKIVENLLKMLNKILVCEGRQCTDYNHQPIYWRACSWWQSGYPCGACLCHVL